MPIVFFRQLSVSCRLISLLVLGATIPALAQTPARPKPAPIAAVPPAEASVRYRSGKAQLDQGHYAAALAQLEPLAQPTARFARAADAAYLAAVAAARLKQWPDAEQLLNLLRTEYPTYPNLPDVLFLQGQASFEQEDFDTGLKALAQLPADKLIAEREALKAAYLPRIKDRTTWLRNLRRYPDDATLARAYADHLVFGGAYTDADRPHHRLEPRPLHAGARDRVVREDLRLCRVTARTRHGLARPPRLILDARLALRVARVASVDGHAAGRDLGVHAVSVGGRSRFRRRRRNASSQETSEIRLVEGAANRSGLVDKS